MRLVSLICACAALVVANAYAAIGPPVIIESYALEHCPRDAITTPDLTSCAQNRVLASDRKINTVARKIFFKISTPYRAVFARAERSWLFYRRISCSVEVSHTVGGSAQPIRYADCELARNRAHLLDLRRLYAVVEEH